MNILYVKENKNNDLLNFQPITINYCPSIGIKKDFNRFYLKCGFLIIIRKNIYNDYIPWGSIAFGYYF